MEHIPLEKEIQREILEWLDKKGYFFWRSNNIPVFGRNNAGKMTFRAMPKYTPKGLPDIICIYRGRFVCFEVKRPNLALKPDQETFKSNCELNGGFYFVARDIDDVAIAFGVIDNFIKNSLLDKFLEKTS